MVPREMDAGQRPGDGLPHLDILRLDAVRAGEGTPTEAAHLRECDACRRRLERLHSLADALGRTTGPSFPVPEHVDAAVMWHARAAVARAWARRRVVRRWTWAAAAAAAMLLAAVVLWQVEPQSVPPAGRSALVAAPSSDIDGSGAVDILDAFALARYLERGRVPDDDGQAKPGQSRWDVTGDGTVDRADVEAIARRAVAIEGGQG